MSSQLVAVTGASGFIAGSVVKFLLREGFRVKGSVRDLSNKAKTSHLNEKFPSLELFEADLLKEGSFDEAFKGCDFVVHTASPFQLAVEDGQRDLVDPAVKGTLSVMNAAKKANVRRVVVTSSVAAILSQAPPPEGKVFTEEDWNTDSTLETSAYRLSKTLAERAAWDFAKKNDMELVTINPAFVIGTPQSARLDSVSVAVFAKMMSGGFKDGVMPMCVGCVSVDDVALAHVKALQVKEAAGNRYIVSSERGYTFLELVPFLRNDANLNAKYGANFPTTINGKVPYMSQFSNAKATKELGIQFSPVEEAVLAAAREVDRLGLATPAK